MLASRKLVQGTSIAGKLRDVDGWLRNRLRYCIWHHWKKPERKRKNLIRLGVNPDDAYAWSRTRKGGWAVAQSPILNTTITKSTLKKRGYYSILDTYTLLNPSVYEPSAAADGVRGALRSTLGGAVYSISGSGFFLSVIINP
ncbi:MAG: hypothetical protein LW688_05025 [Cryomorphaceae bacterium]|nr:hypothetical protein [Cryomorphaceae bacterium]